MEFGFNQFKKLSTLPLAIVVFVLGLSSASAQTPEFLADDIPLDVDVIYHDLLPESDYSDTTRNIIFQLLRFHYSEVDFNDDFSSTMLDSFIDALDGTRFYFTQADIDEFEQYRHELDDMLQSGNLDAGYLIYNRYRHRIIERLVYSIKRIEEDGSPFDFTVDEYMIVDRTEEPWPATEAELHDLWRKQLKSSVLSLRLSENDDDEELDIQEQLSDRFRSQLSQVLKTNNLDVYQRYMDAMTMTFDPHTQYYAPRAAENFNMSMRLSLEGIGAVLTTEDENTKVVSIVSGGPADLAGELKPSDRIIGVAQAEGEFVDVIGWRVDDVVQLIRGEKGSVVRLNIIPESADNDLETRIIKITRDTVKLEEQSAQKEIIEVEHNGEIVKLGVIELPTFYIDFEGMQNGDPDYRSSSRDVKNLLEELKTEGVDAVVMDLRRNGGGSLSEANALAGLFIRTGATVQVRDADGNNMVQGDSNPEIVYDGPLAVLVDHLSASASEIFAGAIQDYERGLVLGSQTFGKGTVQQLIPLGDGQLKLTRSKFYRVSGESTQHQGVMPDIGFPNVLDIAEDIGESALPTALPWDTIEPNYYRPYSDLTPLIPALISRHESRLEADPDFVFILAQIQRAEENRDRNQMSLNEAEVIAEREENDAWRLATENTRRLAKGLEPFADVEAMDADPEEEEELVAEASTQGASPDEEVALDETATDTEDDEELDPYLVESGHILGDLIELSRVNRVSLLAPLN